VQINYGDDTIVAPVVWEWTPARTRLVMLDSEGMSAKKLVNQLRREGITISVTTVYSYRCMPEYSARRDELTLEYALATKSGMLRALYDAAAKKKPKVANDKDTYLQYLKQISEIADEDKKPEDIKITFSK